MTAVYSPKNLPAEFPFSIKFADMEPFYSMEHTFHWHNYYEISYVCQGSGRYYIENRSYDVKAGDIIIINNTEVHYLEVLPPERMRQPVIMFEPRLIWSEESPPFDAQYLKPFIGRNASFSNKIDSSSEIGQKIFSLLTEIEAEYTDQPVGYPLMIKAKLLHIITYLVRHYQDDSRAPIPPDQQRLRLQKLQSVLSYVEQNIGQKISLKQLAAKAYLSPHYFCSFFRASTGFTPVAYINKMRIARAIEQLRSTNQNVSEIALECGFGNLANFNRSFRRLTGRTPRQIRENKL